MISKTLIRVSTAPISATAKHAARRFRVRMLFVRGHAQNATAPARVTQMAETRGPACRRARAKAMSRGPCVRKGWITDIGHRKQNRERRAQASATGTDRGSRLAEPTGVPVAVAEVIVVSCP